jgi:hypothetical protein
MNTRREVWSNRHGIIPKGWVVHNLNGDTADVRIENLAAVPRDNINSIIAPYRKRIRELEKELRLKGENK